MRAILALVALLLLAPAVHAETRNYRRTGGSVGQLNVDHLASLIDAALGFTGTTVVANVVPTQVFVNHPSLSAAYDAAVQGVLTGYVANPRYQTPADLVQTRSDAAAQVAAATDADGKVKRALAAVLLDEINTLRAMYPLPVATITRATTTATVTTRWAHGLTTGAQVTIHGADVAAYNGAVTITVTGATTFTYPVAGSPATPAAGSLLAFPVTSAPPPRTMNQAINAIQNKIGAGSVD